MGRTITGYEGMPHPVIGNNVTETEYWSKETNHSPVVTCPATFQIAEEVKYNWANHNWLTIAAAGSEPSNCTIIPKNRNLSTKAVTDVAIVTMGNDEYPTKCRLVSGATLSRLASINGNVTIYLADADNTKTRVSLGAHFIVCKADGETNVSTLEFGTIKPENGKKLRGKRLAIYMPDTSGVYQRSVAKVSITTDYADCTLTLQNVYGGALSCPVTDKGEGENVMGRGTTTVITPQPKTGYRLKNLKAYQLGTTTETGELKANTDGTYTFTMGTPAYDTVIVPEWEKINYSIEVRQNYLGAAAISTLAAAHFEDTVPVYINRLNSEYRFQSWTWNGTPFSMNNNSGSFIMPESNVIIYITYLRHTLKWINPSLKVVQVQDQNGYYLQFTESGRLTDNFNYFSITDPEPDEADPDKKKYELYKGYYRLKAAPTKILVYRNGEPTEAEFTYNSASATYMATLPITNADTKINYEYKTVAENTVSADGGVCVFSANELYQTVFYYKPVIGDEGELSTERVECIPYYYDGKKWIEVQASYCTSAQIYNTTTEEYRPFDYDDWDHIQLAEDEVTVGSWQICSGT